MRRYHRGGQRRQETHQRGERGRLAASAYPASLVTLILSDIVGDPVASIASGPTVPDPTTYQDATEILRRYRVWESIPSTVRSCLEEGLKGLRPESPKPGDPRLQKSLSIVLGNNRVALNAARKKADSMGIKPLFLGTFIEGEARHVGTVLAGLARETQFSGHSSARTGQSWPEARLQ